MRRSDWSCAFRSPTKSMFSGPWLIGCRNRIGGFAIYFGSTGARGARNYCLFSRLSHLSRTGETSERGRSRRDRTRGGGGETAQSRDRGIGLQFFARSFALSFSGKPRRRSNAPRTQQFVLKFQQFTGPIMAKGLEDTVFYIYNRLAALNEVGGDPQRLRSERGGVSSAQRSAAARLAGQPACHVHARH